MKGLVFKEFIEMVEEKFGEETCEKIIQDSNVPSGGSYTSVGTYDHQEILSLVTQLSHVAKTPVSALVKVFGSHLVSVFHKGFPAFFENHDTFSFLKSVDEIIHVEVLKLYPKAELPQFTYQEPQPNQLIMTYSSKRPFADLAEGLISGSIQFFGEDIDLKATDTSQGQGTSRDFLLEKRN